MSLRGVPNVPSSPHFLKSTGALRIELGTGVGFFSLEAARLVAVTAARLASSRTTGPTVVHVQDATWITAAETARVHRLRSGHDGPSGRSARVPARWIF